MSEPVVLYEEQGSVAVPQARITPILGQTTDENVTLYTDNHHCVISASDSTFRLPTEGADEFPDIPEFDEENAYTFDRGDLVEMVRNSGVSAEIDMSAIPVFGPVAVCLENDVIGGAVERNQEYAMGWVRLPVP